MKYYVISNPQALSLTATWLFSNSKVLFAMGISNRSFVLLRCASLAIVSLLLTTPTVVLAGAGHDHGGGSEFQGGSQPTGSIEVDAETAKQLEIKVEPAARQRLDIGIKTTGQIETLPNQRVEVTAPLTAKVMELLVQPGAKVTAGQPLAVLSSPELVELRVNSQEKQADARAALQKAQVDLKLAKENLERRQTISNAEIAQAQTQLAAAQAQYNRDRAVVSQRSVLKVAQENYRRQLQISTAQIAQATTELAVAQEQYDKDKLLVEQGALPRRQMLDSQAKLERAKAELARGKGSSEVVQAESEVKRAEVDLPFRELRDSQARVAEVQAQLSRVETRREVLEAEAQLKRAQSDLQVAQARLKLSDATYQTRLQQLGTTANAKGLITVTAPISGTVAERTVSIGQSLQDAGGKLMTIVNDTQVFATANIYEKDLNKLKIGQRVRINVASLPNRIFEGQITRIGSLVEGQTRVVPVQAELNNAGGELKPGMFAELEVLTDLTATAILAIPNSAIVDVNGKKLVYVKNGNAFQSVEVTLGQKSGDLVEVKSGLFEKDLIVTQRAPQLYAQSLRGGSKPKEGGETDGHSEEKKGNSEVKDAKANSLPPLGLIGVVGGGVFGTAAFIAGAFWNRRRTRSRLVGEENVSTDAQPLTYETEVYLNKDLTFSPAAVFVEDEEPVGDRH
ncbi:efflux RND transporter periplasmic adaptor subunit [Microcoleus sp. F8-D3]|uniref:Efflux transporter, RND family, MFP subunit n=1 Tax=Phormidium nigroviride PCC 7112 TaxID=179408 RepID=K9VRC9_9CYAN|nr:efflux transporter, RND family, MFP subunit [Oscillatoria nigro-viridis PCC 7112]